MIYGIGVDSINIRRIEKSIQRPHFVSRVFSKEEQTFLQNLASTRKAQSASGCFAAKEAFLKAVGTGIGGFALAEIGVLRKESGAPFYHFTGKTAKFCEYEKITAHLSITNENGIATAFALLEYA